MYNITYKTKTYEETVILDEEGYKIINSLKGKWSPVRKRGSIYFQKRFNTRPGGKIIEMHRYLMGCPKGVYVDHINQNTLDNRFSNLRIVKNSTNLRNGKLRINNTSGVKGVRFNETRDKWTAAIKVNYRTINLGRFQTKEEAVQARRIAEAKYWSI